MAEMQNTTLASRQLVGVEFEQVSNLPEKKISKNISNSGHGLTMSISTQMRRAF